MTSRSRNSSDSSGFGFAEGLFTTLTLMFLIFLGSINLPSDNWIIKKLPFILGLGGIGLVSWITVPSQSIYISTFLEKRPDPSKVQIPIGSCILKNGFHIILLGRSNLYNYIELPNIPFEVYLFRHDPDVKNDEIAQIELTDMTVLLRVTVIAEISKDDFPNSFYNAYFNSITNDFRQQTEIYLNTEVISVYQDKSYDDIANIKSIELEAELGLKRTPGSKYLSAIPGSNKGQVLIEKLANIGIKIFSINLVGLDIPEDVRASRDQIGITQAQQKALLATATGQKEVILRENENRELLAENEKILVRIKAEADAAALRLKTEGEAIALKLKVDGIERALREASQNGYISKEDLIRVLYELPTLQETFKNSSNTIFSLNEVFGLLQGFKNFNG